MAEAEEQQKETTQTKRKLTKSVLPRNLSGGPHGLGDPDDKTLRKMETQVLIPQKVRDKARTEKCIPEVKAFSDCGKEAGLMVWNDCRLENKALWDCAAKWFFNKDFVAEVTKEYLEERSEYRRTGIGSKYQNKNKPSPSEAQL